MSAYGALAGVYDRLTARDQGAYDARTASQYLTTRMHQAQSSDAVSVRSEDGTTVICLREVYELDSYETWLYCRDGWLCELFLFSDAEADLENGEHILPADTLEAETDGVQEFEAIRLDAQGGVISRKTMLKTGSAGR